MAAIVFRIIDLTSFVVLADVVNEGQIETYLLQNQRYEVTRVPLKDVTVVKTAIANLNLPYSPGIAQ